ncbi:hypothetical protein ACJ73_05659 [Blastomyces percursus]|uniref:C2H2-type domain-containing protein n=1 Tax=Blastomyces percursus TaxID=1658174 RepID=A0A1J9Q4G4_9EURO|nr:hypothetical protein ACJ73_05659 [Blastomyces percursus]
MSYQGFGYSPYQYLSGGQNAQNSSYNSLPQIQVTSASETPSTQQTVNRSYGQQSYEWQGQNTTDISGQSLQQQPERESWQSSTNPSQSYRYQQQQQSSYHTSKAAPLISLSLSSQQAQQAQQSQQTHNPLISPSLKVIQYGSSTVESIPMHNSATDLRSTTSISTNMGYQTDPPTQNRLPANVSLPIDRPNSAQRSRTAAASAITALSSNVPAPHATAQRRSTDQAGSPSTSHSYAPSYGTPRSNLVTPNPTARQPSSADHEQPYRHKISKSQYNRASTGSAQSNISRNQQSISQNHNTYSLTVSVATPSSSSMYSEPSASQPHRVAGYNNTNAPHQPSAASHPQNTASNPPCVNATSEYQPVNTSQSQSYQPATTGFIDPSQIYNPYYQEYQKTKAAEAEAEAERVNHKEAEKQREVERQKDIEKQNETERRKRSTRELAEMKKENRKRAVQAEIVQKITAAKEFATSVRVERIQAESLTAANPPTVEKPKPGRKPGPKPRVQAPNPTDSAQREPEGTQKKQRRLPRKSQVEDPVPAAATESSGITHQTQSVPNTQPNAGQRQALSTTFQSIVEGRPDEDEDLEMKLMLEKMKELKSKDPNKFAKLLGGLEVSTPVTTPPQTMEEQRTSGVLVSTTPTSASMNPTEETNSMHDRGKFPAARRRRRSKPVGVAGHRAQSLPTRPESGRTPQPPPAAASQPETNKKNQPSQTGGPMEIEKLIDSDESQREPSQAPVQATAPPTQSVPEPATQTKQSQNASLPAQVQAATPPTQPEAATEPKQTKEENPKAATIWPEPKRLALAQAASRYIDDVISNRNKARKCPPEMVLSLIDRNPSYIELCGMLESRGYHLNRVHFAKHLLKAMPELTAGSSPSAGPNTAANGLSSTPTTGQTQAPPNTASIPPPIQYTEVHTANSTPIPPGTTARSEPGAQVVGSKTAQPAPSSTTMPPPTNRVPGYFVPYQLPQSVPSENRVPGFIGSPPRPPITFSNGTQAPVSAGPHSCPERPPPIRRSRGGPVPSPIEGKLKPKFRVPAPPAHIPAPGSKEALAKKRTFAEIVDFTQLASDDDDDKPPLSKGPRLQDISPQSDTNMDVDVEEAPAPAPETPEAHGAPAKTLDLSQFRMPDADYSTSNETLRGRSDIVKPLNKTEALKTRYYDPKTIARDLLIATGRHPTERALNQHLSKLRDNFSAVDNSSDLRTFRWDIVDPGRPPPPEVPFVTAVSKPPVITVREYTKHGSQIGRLPNSHPRDPVNAKGSSQLPHTPSQLHISQTVNNSDDSSPHLRQESDNNINTGSSVMSPTPQIAGNRRRGRPPVPKNKPRFADRVEIAIPTSSSPYTPRTPFHMYKCEWKGCDAQLHNLQTIRKHVTRLHIPRDMNTEASCLWAGCSEGRNKFTRDDLAGHLENNHLSTLAWTLGEGPGSVRSGHRDYNIDDCLNDSNGRAVIARASAKGIRPTLILPAAYRSIRSFNKMYGNESDKAKALEVLRALEMKQVRVGTALGRGGCTFMNEKRQETVMAFESIFEIVPEDDDGL